jgi:hypothetical protein
MPESLYPLPSFRIYCEKRKAMTQKANVSHDRPKIDKIVRGGELPCVRCSRPLYRGQTVVSAMLMSMGKKSDEEAKKQQRKEIDGKSESL